jgi:hypothetical protein
MPLFSMCKSYSIVDTQGSTVGWCCADSQREALSWIPPGYSLGVLLPGFDRSKYHRITPLTYRSSPYSQKFRSQPGTKKRRTVNAYLSPTATRWLDNQPVAAKAVAELIEMAASGSNGK